MPDVPLLNNRYQIEERLGSGGMSVVYRARDTMLERTVALKVLREDFSSDDAFRERFRQEAKAVANLSHPNIVTVHDFGLDAGRLFIVMEYVPGTDLKTILQQRSRLTLEESIQLMIQACAGIGYAHRAGLVHCDVKPHNMLVTPDQRLKVADFGIARALASIPSDEKSEIVWGSPQYFSPEQASGEPPSPASDVYSLGIILYEMITGRTPFVASDANQLIQMHRSAFPRPPHLLNPAVPPAIEEIILKVLSKEPSARYRTADQFGRVLITFSRAGSRPARAEAARAAPASPRPEASYPPPAPLPARVTPSPRPTQAPPQAAATPTQAEEENPLDIDWVTWGLALLAFLAVGGLIPLWLWVYLTFNP